MNERRHHIGPPPRRVPPHRTVLHAAAVAMLGLASLAAAQNKASDKKLYCWNENGRKLCSDALPPSAVDRQRVEINQTSGTAVRAISRALTETEREQAAIVAKAQESEAARLRREMAMVQTFLTEADLERSFRNRFGLLDESLKSSAIATKNLRESLLVLLRQANELEMEKKPVGKRLIEKIRTQQQELRQLIALQKRQTNERAELDVQFQSALLRYRELKRSLEEGTAPPVATAVAPTPAGG